MRFLPVSGNADGSSVAGRTARANGKTDGPHDLLEALRAEKAGRIPGRIYQKVQIDLTYYSNRIDGNRLTRGQTRLIYETNMLDSEGRPARVDDIVETANHFCCVDLVIDQARRPLSEAFIKRLHLTLMNGSSISRKSWFAVGDYKRLPNQVGGGATAAPKDVPSLMRELLGSYNAYKKKTLEEIVAFHQRLEAIHPFQDGNGRVGRLVMFKECLRNSITPFIIDEELKPSYYRGLREWESGHGCLIDTCLAAQDKFKGCLGYFEIPYKD